MLQYPVDETAAAIQRRFKRENTPHSKPVAVHRGFRMTLAASMLGACAALLFFVLLPGVEDGNNNTAEADIASTRIKGGPSLLVYRHQSGKPEILQEGSFVEERDELQIAYSAAGEKFGVILSIDGRGEVTLHYPLENQGTTSLLDKSAVLLPYAFTLDNAPDFERFFLVTSSEPLRVEDVLSAAQNLGKHGKAGLGEMLELPERYSQKSLCLKKR